MVCPVPGRDADEVEAAGTAPRAVGLKPSLGGTAEAFFLGGRERFVGVLKSAFGAGLHLDEHKSILLFRHDVQLKMTGTPVAGEYAPAHAAEAGGGRVFTFGPGLCPGRGGPLFRRGAGGALPLGQTAQEA